MEEDVIPKVEHRCSAGPVEVVSGFLSSAGSARILRPHMGGKKIVTDLLIGVGRLIAITLIDDDDSIALQSTKRGPRRLKKRLQLQRCVVGQYINQSFMIKVLDPVN